MPMSAGDATGTDRTADRRAIVYCVIPADLAPRLHDLLRAHFRDDPTVEVIVERRRRERRGGTERRRVKGAPPGERERRKVRSASGRRVGERRAALVPIDHAPPLPHRARRYAEQITFVERLEPSTQQAEDLDTARLVTRFQAGESDPFTILYNRYFERVYGYLRALLRDSHEAEDVTQEVFTKVFEVLPRYERRRQPFRAWLFTIVRNHAVSQLRRRRQIEVADPDELRREHEPAEGAEAELPVLQWLTDRDLMLFVERLPLTQRQVLLLRYGMEMKAVEVAEILELSPAQVRSLQRHALAFLRARLTAVGRDPRGRHGGREPRMRRWQKQAVVLRRRRFALQRR